MAVSVRVMFLNRLAETGGFRRLIVSPDLATPWCLEVPQACVGNIGGGRAEYGQLIPSHDFVPHNCNPESKACKHPYLWTASQKLGLVSTAISLQHCSSLPQLLLPGYHAGARMGAVSFESAALYHTHI